MRRDWLGRALAALIGIWVAGMIVAPTASRVTASVDLRHAQRALPDRTRVVSAREEAPESDSTPPARAVARDISPACSDGGRRAADELPTAPVVEFACITLVARVEPATAGRRRQAPAAHLLPPALGPPSALV